MTRRFFDDGRKAGNDDGARLGGRIRRRWGAAVRVGTFTLALPLLLTLAACAQHSSTAVADSIPLPPPPPPAQPPALPAAHAAVASVPHPAKPAAAPGPAPKLVTLDTIAPSAIDSGTIAKARQAMQDVAKLNQLFTEEMATTTDTKIQGAIYADFEKKYMAALGAQGLSLNTYLHVLAVAAKDPGTAKQLYAPDAPNAPK